MLAGFIILLLFQLLGELITQWYQLPIPGAVIGMFLLFIFLLITGGPGKSITSASERLIRYLALFFLPAGVGIFFLGEQIGKHWLAVIYAASLGTIAAIIVTSLCMTFFTRKKTEQN